MTKPDKLYAELLRDRSKLLAFREFERLLEAFGWRLKRMKGSHRHYHHQKVPNILTINPDGASAHRYQVRLLLEYVEKYSLHMES